MRANVLVVDSDPVVVAQVRAALLLDGVVSGTAHSAEAALQAAAQSRPDLLVTDLDIGLPEGGIDLAASMKRRWGTAALFLAHHVHRPSVRAAAVVDACGILLKPLDSRQVEATFRFALERLAAQVDKGGDELPGLDRLRPREREVVRLLMQHIPVRQIAERLGISPQTVRNHLKGAFRRTGTGTQHELLQWLTDRRA
jgi:two-component system, NarL family, response regulator DesR